MTDAGRDRTDPHDLGKGYPFYAADFLRKAYPTVDFEFLNLGISGNRSDQLFDRLFDDVVSVNPDVLSVLIGINDVWHRYEKHPVYTTDAQFEANYRAFLNVVKEKTHAKILLMTPFLLDTADKQHFRPDVERLFPIIQTLAAEYADVLLPLHTHFEKALPLQPAPHFYSADGVHPNENGAAFIGKLYAEAVKSLV